MATGAWQPSLSREEIALRLLCAMLQDSGKVSAGGAPLGENEVRLAFMLAQTFERVSDEIGGRPFRGVSHSAFEDDDE